MNKKEPLLIALDMDGTLLNNKKRISLKTLFYLRKLVKKGNKIILCSGRPSRALYKYYNMLNLDTPMVCYNGAYVFSPTDKHFKPIIYDYSEKFVIETIKKIKNNIVNVMCETNDEIFIDKEDMFLNKFFWYKNMKIHINPLEQTLDKSVMTFIVHTTEDYKQKGEIEKVLEKYPDIGVTFWTGSPYFEFCHKEATKGSGLKIIAEYLNINKENIIAIGDSTNDIEMLDYAGTSIAMINGKHNLLNAKIITKFDNNHNGIYYALKEIIVD